MAKEFAPHLPPLAFESEVGDAKLQTILVPMRHTGLPCDPYAVNAGQQEDHFRGAADPITEEP